VLSSNHATGNRNREDSIAGLSRDDVLRAMEANLWGLWSNFGRGSDCALYDEPDALYYDTPIPTLPYNTVLRFSAAEQADERIDAIIQHYQQRAVPHIWVVHPSSQPVDLSERLLKRGLAQVEVLNGMAADLAELPDPESAPEGIDIREVCDEDEIHRFFELIAWRWNVPPEAVPYLKGFNEPVQIGTSDAKGRCWLAWRDGEPVAKVVLYCGGGAAGLYGVMTRPEARGQGLASILTLVAFRAAREESGHRLGVLQSSPIAESLYARLGFRPVAPFKLFAAETFQV